jgi:hypothetical protein
MMPKRFFNIFLSGMILFFLAVPIIILAGKNGNPRTFLLKVEHLALTKKLCENGNPMITQSMNALIREAEKALSQGPFTVTTKKYLPPSGDPHDFLAFGAYFWPNSNSKDGFPWVRRDGYPNPDNVVDWKRINAMATNVYNLTLAYYFTGKNKYAQHAAFLLRTWFIDKSTRMNPNAKYGKVVPGRRKGGYPVAGLGTAFRYIYDAAGILESSSAWSDKDRNALLQWTREFMQWVETSSCGKKEKKAKNNHGTFYDLNMALQAMYIGDYDKARDIIQCYMIDRIPQQFKPNGSQPFEMAHSNNYFYHIYNLEAAFDIAALADHFDDINIWDFETQRSAALRRSSEFLLPYLTGQWQWDYFRKDYFDIDIETRWRILRKAAVGFDDPLYVFAESTFSFSCLRDQYFVNLTHPKAAIKTVIKSAGD